MKYKKSQQGGWLSSDHISVPYLYDPDPRYTESPNMQIDRYLQLSRGIPEGDVDEEEESIPKSVTEAESAFPRGVSRDFHLSRANKVLSRIARRVARIYDSYYTLDPKYISSINEFADLQISEHKRSLSPRRRRRLRQRRIDFS